MEERKMLNKNYKPWKKIYSIYEQRDNGLEEKRDLIFVFSTEDIEEVRLHHNKIGVNLLIINYYDGDGVGYRTDNYYNYKKEDFDTVTMYLKGKERGI